MHELDCGIRSGHVRVTFTAAVRTVVHSVILQSISPGDWLSFEKVVADFAELLAADAGDLGNIETAGDD